MTTAGPAFSLATAPASEKIAAPMMPVSAGHAPVSIVAWPGAVSVGTWS